jgi:energy-coupling factor transporter transmembrane protein EcfT
VFQTFAYRSGSSLLHRAPPWAKLLGLLAIPLCSGLFGLPALAVSTALILILSALAQIRPWELLRGSKALAIMALLVILYRSIDLPPRLDRQGLVESLMFAWTLFSAFASAALFFASTTSVQVQAALGRGRIALSLALMLRFLPCFFEVWENAEAAYRARAGKKGLAELVCLIPLVTEKMLEKASDTAAALASRSALC